MTPVEIIQIICASVIPIAVVGYIFNRYTSTRENGTKGLGIGVRGIQFIAVASFIPGIIILALANKVDSSTIAALIGAMIGYLFSNISNFDNK